MQALVLLTFTTSLSATLKMQYHNTPQECTCCAAIPDAGYAVFTTGAETLLDHPGLFACTWGLCYHWCAVSIMVPCHARQYAFPCCAGNITGVQCLPVRIAWEILCDIVDP